MSSKEHLQNINLIMLLEDDKLDANITKKAFYDLGFTGNIRHFSQVSTALSHLSEIRDFCGEQHQKNQALPDIIFIDINLPCESGFELLEKVKSDPWLCRIPVVVLSSSNSQKDVVKAYELGTSSYIQKPLKYDEFKSSIQSFLNYYNKSALLPGWMS